MHKDNGRDHSKHRIQIIRYSTTCKRTPNNYKVGNNRSRNTETNNIK